MNIAVDIDGTVLDFSNKFTNWMIKRGTPILHSQIVENFDSYVIYEKQCFDECFDMPTYPEAPGVLLNLAISHSMSFLTKRGNSCVPEISQALKELTIKWQQKNYPYFGGVFFAQNKEEYFKDKMFDLMIEDDASNSNKIAEYAPVLLLSRSWNHGVELHPNIAVIENWKEIEMVINNFDKFYNVEKGCFKHAS